jgi:hypothetical protein
MSVINKNLVLPSDVIFKGKSSRDKHLDMVYYEDCIKIPSQKIIEHFGDRIKYANPSETIFYLEDDGPNKKLQSISRNHEVLSFNSYETMISFLEKETYLFYFVKCCEVDGIYNLYVYIVDNIVNMRNRKLEELGI